MLLSGDHGNCVQKGLTLSYPAMSSDLRMQFESNLRQFIWNELEMGITFAHLALDKSPGEAQRRSRQNARKAYDTANHFLNKHVVGESAMEPNLLARLIRLRHLLLQLVETIEE